MISETGGKEPVGATDVGRSTESEVVGCAEVSDVPGMMNGPRMLDGSNDGASEAETDDDVPERMTSGSVPVGAATWREVVGASVG